VVVITIFQQQKIGCNISVALLFLFFFYKPPTYCVLTLNVNTTSSKHDVTDGKIKTNLTPAE